MSFLFIILGLIFGSFLNVLIYRLPNKLSIIFPSSHCIYCNVSIKWYHNIPIFSFLLLKGFSHCCNKAIPKRYLFIEISSLLLWVWSYYYIPSIYNQILFLIMSSFLLVIIFTDYNYFYIPIELNILMFFSCLLLLRYNVDFDLKYHFFSMLILLAYFIFLTFIANFFLKKESMGYGDIILIGVISFWLGLYYALVIIFIASILSIFHWLIIKISTKDESIILPFGSTLSFSTILIYMIAITLKIEIYFF